MKKIVKMMALLGLLSGLFGIVATRTPEVKAEAATVQTKRVWMKNSITADWDKDGAGTAIHYWGGAQGTSWPGVRVKWDSSNSLVYFDLPADVTTYMFVRVSGSGPISDWGAKTNDLVYSESIGKYYDLTGPIAWGGATTPGSFVSFTPVTTLIVSDFAATIDTSAEACVKENAIAAITAYNALSTFEQDQFDVLIVGGGVTGLQRLNFLKSFYGISTPLNQNITQSNNDKNFLAISIIGVLSVSAIAGYYFLKTKKAI